MPITPEGYAAWLEQADIPEQRQTPELDALLQAVYRFRQQQGSDYYSTRLLSHFLLHCESGLKVAQIARLAGIARPTASRQQGMTSKAAIQQAHHRMRGRSHGKLLPRYAGPIASFLLSHPKASQAELIDFVAQHFGVNVSRIALYKFLKKYGLHDVAEAIQPPTPEQRETDTRTDAPEAPLPAADTAAPLSPTTPPPSLAASTPPAPPATPAPPDTTAANEAVAPWPVIELARVNEAAAPLPVIELASVVQPGGPTPLPFSSGGRNLPGRSC
jgi:transposase